MAAQARDMEPEVEELVLPGLVGKKEDEEKDVKADKVTGQRLKLPNVGDDSDNELDSEDEDDVSQSVTVILGGRERER